MNNFRRRIVAAGLSAAVLFAPLVAQAQILSGNNQPNFTNLIDNGNFNVAQRGTASVGSITTTAKYADDRWAVASGTSTTAQTINITTGLPAAFTNGMSVQRTSAQTGLVKTCILQEVPTLDVTPLAGQPITLSFWASAGANFSAASSALVAQVTTGTGSDEGLGTWLTGLTGAASAIPTANATVTLTTGMQRFAVTGTIPATATEAVVNICFTPVGTAGTSDLFNITGVQLQQGTVASNFEWVPAGIEFSKLLRYFWQIADPAATVEIPSSCFVTAANTTVKCGVYLPVPMRAAPTTTVGTAASFGIVQTAGTAGTCTTLAATASSNSTQAIGLTCTTGGTIALGSATPLIGAAAASAVLSASADF